MDNFAEIFGNSAVDPIPLGFRADDLIIGLRITGADPDTGVLGEGIDEQLRLAYANLRSCVEAAGASTDNVGQVSFYLKDFEHRNLINGPWNEMFPDPEDRPTYKFMPAPLAGDQLVQMEFLAVAGERRRDIAVKGVAHTNPIPMAVRIGRYLFSSRMLPYDPATEKAAEGAETQADFIFEHAETILTSAGMGWADVVQGRAFYVEESGLSLIESGWAQRFPDAATRPPLHPVRYGAGGLLVMLEFIGIADREARA